MKTLSLMLSVWSLFLFGTSELLAQDGARWLRYPAISPDGKQIAFTYKGDLYLVSSAGGEAKQLTFHQAHDYKAVWSRDGKRLAFASDRYGNFDVFTMSAKGGEAKRLTFHSNDEYPYSFSPEDKTVVFSTSRMDKAEHRQYPHGSQTELYQVPTEGGWVDQIFTVPAEEARFSSDGSFLVYHDRKGGENEFRKHHTSSITRDIWRYDPQTGKHRQLTNSVYEDRQPVFNGDESALYFLSERSGTFNVHKLALENPSQVEQVTDFKTHPVRFLSFAAGTLVFSHHGDLYTMAEGDQPKKLTVTIRTQEKTNPDKFISINGGVEEMVVSPNGKEIAFVARGEVFVTAVDGSMTKRLTETADQERFVSFSPDGKSVLYSGERDGKWSIYKAQIVREEEPFFFASTLIRETPVLENDDENYLPSISPDGKKLAYIKNRRTLVVRDLDSGNETLLLTPKDLFHMRDGDKYFVWSPDSKWILADWNKLISNSELLLLSADGKTRKNLTESGYQDSQPKWVNEGKQLIWFSNRDGMRSYANSGNTESDVYTMFFDQEAWDHFNLNEEDYKLQKEIEKLNKEEEPDEKSDKKKKKDKPEATKIDLRLDLDHAEDRIARLTLHSSRLGDAVLSKDGEKLYYLARFEEGLNLWESDIRKKETKMLLQLNARRGSLTWDKDQENLYLLSDGRISKIKLESKKREPITIKDEMSFDEQAERASLFEHIWLRTNAIFYHSNFHGIDWNFMKDEYQVFLPYIGNNYEFAELISEMIGELNASHAGARFSDSIENGDATASLGIFWDWDFDGDGLKITEILRGGPLDKSKLNVHVGDVVRAIDGHRIDKDQDVAALLNRKTGELTALDISDQKGKNAQQITVKPISLGQERGLLYDRWVRINREEVEQKSGGKLGYVHIPGMSDGPYRDVLQDLLGRYFDAEGVIVDTRFNGGGDLVADLAMFFTGEAFNTYLTETKVVGGEPNSRWSKPSLVMFNEANYSDGSCFAQGYVDLEIGKTVGMPTPGTCSWAGWERLSNGMSWGVIPISSKNKAGEWAENNQTEPQFKVKNMPDVINQGRDQQLEKAIEELLKDVN